MDNNAPTIEPQEIVHVRIILKLETELAAANERYVKAVEGWDREVAGYMSFEAKLTAAESKLEAARESAALPFNLTHIQIEEYRTENRIVQEPPLPDWAIEENRILNAICDIAAGRLIAFAAERKHAEAARAEQIELDAKICDTHARHGTWPEAYETAARAIRAQMDTTHKD